MVLNRLYYGINNQIICNIYIFPRRYVNFLYDIVDLNSGMHFLIKLNVQNPLIRLKISLRNIFCAGLYLNELFVSVLRYCILYIYVCYYVKTFNCCMFMDIMPPCQSSIFLMYFMSSFCTYFLITFHLLPYLSLYICYFFFLPVHTSFFNFCTFLLVNKLNWIKLNWIEHWP